MPAQSGRLVSVIDPMDQTSSATYDNVGFVKTVTDASGGTTTYNYDDINRLIETVNAIGAKETYTYNSKGLIQEITNSRNQTTQYTTMSLDALKPSKMKKEPLNTPTMHPEISRKSKTKMAPQSEPLTP